MVMGADPWGSRSIFQANAAARCRSGRGLSSPSASEVGGSVGAGESVVEPPAIVGPVLRLLELQPELPLVLVAIPIDDGSGRLAADREIAQEVGDPSFSTLASRVRLRALSC